MAGLISHGFVFWYPTMSLDSGQAGVVNDPNRLWFKNVASPEASSTEYFWYLSASLPGLDNNDIPTASIHDYGLTYFTGAEAPTDNFDTHQERAQINYEENGGLVLQASLRSAQLWGSDNENGSILQPSFFGPTDLDFSYDFSKGGGILIITSSNQGSKGEKTPVWYWTAGPDTSGSSPTVYNNPEEQATWIAHHFIDPTAWNSLGIGVIQPEKALTRAIVYAGGIFLTASEFPGGSGDYVLDIPDYMKEGSGVYPVYKLGPTA